MLVLSYLPPKGHRVYPNNGNPHPTAERAAMQVIGVLGARGQRGRALVEFARRVRDNVGRDVTHPATGIVFRLDNAEITDT